MSNEYGIGYTRKGTEFYFDKEDYDLINPYCWSDHQGYLRTCLNIINGKKQYIMMHQLIAKEYGFHNEPDHINGKRFDNRKENLRDITHKNNSKNTKLYSNNTSGYKGVSFNKHNKKWFSYITSDNKRIFLGYFNNKEDAIEARRLAEEKYHKEYARKKEDL